MPRDSQFFSDHWLELLKIFFTAYFAITAIVANTNNNLKVNYFGICNGYLPFYLGVNFGEVFLNL